MKIYQFLGQSSYEKILVIGVGSVKKTEFILTIPLPVDIKCHVTLQLTVLFYLYYRGI